MIILILILIFAFIYTLSLRYKFKMVSKNLSIIIILYYLTKFIMYDINYKFMMLLGLGFVIGVIWMSIWSKILDYPFKLKFINFNLNISRLSIIIIEEIIWRGTLERYFINDIIIILLIAILFSYSHNKTQKPSYYVEFYLFSFLLSATFLIFNNIFITIGIHICRNNFIINASKEYE